MIKLQYAVLMLLAICHTGVLAATRSSELDTDSLRRAIEDLNRSYPGRYRGADYLKQLEQWEKELPGIRAGVVKAEAHALDKAKRFKAFKRAALLANPLLDFDQLLIIKRTPLGDPRLAKNHRGLGEFNGVPQQSSFQLYRIPNLAKYENEICVLSDLRD